MQLVNYLAQPETWWVWAAEYLIFVLVLAPVVGFVVTRKRTWWQSWIQAGTSYALASVIKDWLAIPRPYLAPGQTSLLSHPPVSGSFPSGHATVAFALAFGLVRQDPVRRWWYLVIAATVAVARVMVNVHRWQDIIAGALLGWIVSWLMLKLSQHWKLYARLIDN